MASLASRLKEPSFLETNFAADPNVTRIKAYFLSGRHIKAEIKCAAENCLVKVEDEKDPALKILKDLRKIYHPMCFCFSCDRVSHLKCLDLNLDSFSKLKAPYICADCEKDPKNKIAVQFHTNAEWGQGTNARRKKFLKPDSILQFPELVGNHLLETAWDPEDVRAFQAAEPVKDLLTRQKEEMELLFKHFAEYKEKSEAEATQLRQKIEELERSRQSSSFSQFDTTQYFTAHVPLSSTFNAPMNQPNLTTCESILKKLYLNSSDKNNNVNKSTTQQTEQNESQATENNSAEFSFPNVDTTNLSPTEQLLLNTSRVCIESANAQKLTATSKLLELKRKALPKIGTFKGDPKGWISFKKEVERYRSSGCYDDEIVKFYVFGALEGNAKKRVEDLIDTGTLEEVLKVLESSFGHTPTIIKAVEDEILKIKIKGELLRSDVVQINSLIQTYFTTCRYANVSRINSNMLAEHILDQLDFTHRMFFRQQCRMENPGIEIILPDLDMVYSFLETLSASLDVKPKDKREKPAQMQVIAAPTANYGAQQPRHRDTRFIIRDINIAKYQGYNLNLVKALIKKCLCCNATNHFTLECSQFKNMSDEERAQFVTNKNLCRNCLLTSDHYARDCALKPSCGRKISEVIFCSGKHHALLHKFGGNTGLNSNRTNYSNRGNGHANRSRRNFNNNTQRAQKVYDRNQTDVVDNSTNKIANVTQNVPKSGTEAQNSSTANLNTITTNPRFTYNVTAPIQSQNITMGSDKTIKVFKHRFFGPNGETIGYSVGDSGSEVTIMREDLREQLGIEGKPVSLNLQWTDSQIRVIPAREVSLQVKGMNKSDELITLNPCYAIDADYFSLPARSLDVEALKKHFPYLKEARFDSYFKATPILLIGSLHASCIEAIAPVLHGGENKPVGIKTRLGWSIYGGSIESLSANDSSCLEVTAYKSEENSQSDSNPDENLNKLLTYYSSFESLGIRSKPAYITDNERKAVELITNELRILPNGTVEIPLIWIFLKIR
ncbi:hypothetical protein PVAND_017643 [Polypedilum vanderplanki]|uniref:Peptidase aspartic putative domain-containing protein n=1 Tax=Polypedilum vanderplanki TaxID=319348 RepID=A0A9J6B982_POLVA|nr:hypothetical protein PVAND_017643 [Polypedilum vanderplanki]